MYTIKGFSANSGDDSTASSGINASGDICGGVYAPGGQRGAVWQSFNPTSPAMIVPNSYLYGINAGNDAVGATGMNNSPTQRACIFSDGQLHDLFNLVGEYSVAIEINNAGRVVGWSNQEGSRRGFVYDSMGGGVTFLDPFEGDENCGAFAVNQAGDVAGKSGTTRVFLFADGATTEVGEASWVAGINAGRQIVGSIGKPPPGNWSAVVIDAASATPSISEIPLPPGAVGSHGQAINDSGSVVGTSWSEQSYNGDQHAFVYANGQSSDLNDLIPSNSGWLLEFAHGINNKGQIVCDGTYLGEHATAVLTPEDQFAGIRRFDKLLYMILFGGVAQDGGGFGITPGGGPVPIDPWGPLREAATQLTTERRDVLTALASEVLASSITSADIRDPLRAAAVIAARAGLDTLLNAPAVQVRMADTVRVGMGAKRRMRDGKPIIN